MSPESRKTSSEAKLRALGIPVNQHLPRIETQEATTIRSNDEVLRRLVALWAVDGKAVLGAETRFAANIAEQGLQDWLSERERDFLFSKEATEKDSIHFSWQLEAF
ncbi:MAG: DUF4272 domain-containing protein [Burkholderiales bacterium]